MSPEIRAAAPIMAEVYRNGTAAERSRNSESSASRNKLAIQSRFQYKPAVTVLNAVEAKWFRHPAVDAQSADPIRRLCRPDGGVVADSSSLIELRRNWLDCRACVLDSNDGAHDLE